MKGPLVLSITIAGIVLSVFLTGAIDESTKDALKVGHLLKTIGNQPPRSTGKDLTAEVTEKELNAYIAYRLAQENDTPVRNLTLGLLENNHIEGNVKSDAQKLNLGALLGNDPEFDFKGVVHSRNGAARLELIALKLNGRPVSPGVLDFILNAAALYYGTQAPSVDDWFVLPKGIKRLNVTKGRTFLYY